MKMLHFANTRKKATKVQKMSWIRRDSESHVLASAPRAHSKLANTSHQRLDYRC